MADLTPGVTDVLVRLMTGKVDPAELNERTALGILAMCADSRQAAHVAATWLADKGGSDGKGLTLDQVVERLRAEYETEVHRSTVARWTGPVGVDRRRRRRKGGDDA